MALVLVGSVLTGAVGTVAAQSSVSVSQTAQGTTSVAPGDTVTIDVSIDTTESGGPAIQLEDVPSGWTVQAVDNDGGYFQSTNYEWFWLQDSELNGNYSHTVTYEVTVPGDASDGTYQIDAVGSSQGNAGVDDDYQDTDGLSITVDAPEENTDPTASFTALPTDPDVGESVSFDATGSSDSDGSIASYSWDFGDGDTATSATPSHTYDSAGTYTVTLTVEDDDGATDQTTQQVTVSEPPAAGPGTVDILITPGTGTEASSYNNGAWQVENTGDKAIQSIEFDLSTTAMPDVVFDPEGSAGDQAAKGLEVDDQTGDGVGVVSTADGDIFSQPHNGVNGDDGYDVMTVEFDDFESGEELVFSTDNDPTSIKGATLPSQESGPISGLEMARGTVTVTYADGSSQTTQLFGDGSAGGAQATLDDSIASAPTIGVDGVTLNSGALDSYHSTATVGTAPQTVTVTGQPGQTVTLLHYEAELELSNVPDYDGTPGYDIEDYEANKVEQVDYQTVTLNNNGEANVPVTLLNSTDVGGYNYFIATHGEPGSDTGMDSNVVVLKYEQNQPPSAAITVSPSDPVVGDTVTFDASGSDDPDGSIANYAWDLDGDGTTDASGPTTTTTFAYATAGDYDVTLTVEDEDGAIDTATQTVSVSETSVPADFQVSNLNAPDAATKGDLITVSADVTNDGDEEATQTVEFRLDVDGNGTLEGDEELVSQEVTLDGGETQTVTFSDLDTSGLLAGSYAHGVFTENDSATATITIDESDASASETSVSLSPDSAEVVVGDTETYDVVVDSADGGVGAYEITVSLDDASVASITDVTIADNPGLTNVSYAEDDSSVTITAALVDTDDTGSVSIASITVEGTAEGSSDLSVDVQALGNEGGESYTVTDENGASVSVIEIGPIGEFSDPPTDPDDDGLYEDVNGDGVFDIVDAQALFANLDDETVQNNPDKFDFNQDGDVDVVDVQKLFNEVP